MQNIRTQFSTKFWSKLSCLPFFCQIFIHILQSMFLAVGFGYIHLMTLL